jgi:hypothetical protein
MEKIHCNKVCKELKDSQYFVGKLAGEDCRDNPAQRVQEEWDIYLQWYIWSNDFYVLFNEWKRGYLETKIENY